eukprot:12416980-Karenia_brevis.AAC.1
MSVIYRVWAARRFARLAQVAGFLVTIRPTWVQARAFCRRCLLAAGVTDRTFQPYGQSTFWH